MQRQVEPEGLSPQAENSPPTAEYPRESPKWFATSSVPSPFKGSVEAGKTLLLADFSWRLNNIKTGWEGVALGMQGTPSAKGVLRL